jgi:ABC-type nickel/cobalt efflux system permease component RcnA
MFLQYLFYFGWGAGHAFQPGHGKAIISAYMVGGTRGIKPSRAVRNAVILGLITAATHTVVVYAIALAVRFAGRFADEVRLQGITSLVGAVLVILVGVWMLRERIREHGLSHGVVDHHGQPVGANHGHSHLPARTDAEKNPNSVKRLVALGISGGIVPCKGALLIYFGSSAATELFDELADPLAALAVYSLGIAATMIGVALISVFFAKTVERLAGRFRTKEDSFWGKLYRFLRWAGPIVVLGAGGYLLLYSFNFL